MIRHIRMIKTLDEVIKGCSNSFLESSDEEDDENEEEEPDEKSKIGNRVSQVSFKTISAYRKLSHSLVVTFVVLKPSYDFLCNRPRILTNNRYIIVLFSLHTLINKTKRSTLHQLYLSDCEQNKRSTLHQLHLSDCEQNKRSTLHQLHSSQQFIMEKNGAVGRAS